MNSDIFFTIEAYLIPYNRNETQSISIDTAIILHNNGFKH